MVASCALGSHPNADLKSASSAFSTMYLNAMASIPYLTGGRSGTQMIEDERMAAIEEYKRMRDRILKKKGPENAVPGPTK